MVLKRTHFVDLYPVIEELEGTGIGVGAENMHFEESGAYTGEISPLMLKDGCFLCCIGTF